MENDVLAELIASVLGDRECADSPVETLQDIRLESMARLLHLRIAGMHSDSARQACYYLLDDLSETETGQLLRSPALCESLRRGDQEPAIPALLNAALSSGIGYQIDAWSVLGDCWLGPSRPPRYPFLAERHRRFWAPRLACRVPVDMSLGDRLTAPSAGLLQPLPLPEGDLFATVLHMDRALDLLSEVYPLGHQAFAGLASNVVVRRDVARPVECWGATSGIAIGRVVVVNAMAQADVRMLGDILLHESTHCAMDCAELINPLWCSSSAEQREATVSVHSPWTSNALTPHAFAHACMVWAVLLRYWAACDHHYGADAISHARRSFIERGFSAMDAQLDLGQALGTLSATAWDAVTVARRMARAIGPSGSG